MTLIGSFSNRHLRSLELGTTSPWTRPRPTTTPPTHAPSARPAPGGTFPAGGVTSAGILTPTPSSRGPALSIIAAAAEMQAHLLRPPAAGPAPLRRARLQRGTMVVDLKRIRIQRKRPETTAVPAPSSLRRLLGVDLTVSG